ncbi:MAG TPA: hypothetical protein VMX18_00310 [Candidatus Bipolaricaulota bacterium]|nr:hypothetical protein [Candidatus Bipolaricaulota bacterium]
MTEILSKCKIKEFDLLLAEKKNVLALGPESAGNFSVYINGKVYYCSDFGDLLEEERFDVYKKALFELIDRNNLIPDIIRVDLHPAYKTSKLGEELALKFNCRLERVQHHIAHVYSAVFDQFAGYESTKDLPILRKQGEYESTNTLRIRRKHGDMTLPTKFLGIACDGTGLGLDGKIWGGEVFQYQISNIKNKLTRIGHLENQLLCGGDAAIKEPARMLLSILLNIKKPAEVWPIFSAFYTEQQFDTLVKMREQKFNSLETSSAGRVLDAVSVLLGFCGNERKYKHEPIDLLEKNSTQPFELEPVITEEQRNKETEEQWSNGAMKQYVLNTSYLFEWLLENLDKDKGRLAATVQKYIIEGLIEIAKRTDPNLPIYFSGGMANNRIMSQIAMNNGLIMAENIDRGDNALSLGQLTLFL